MAEFNIRTDAVDVEQIMRQIRARIQEKRGVDYTEQQIQELANVKLERFLDPKGVRSDLVDQFKRARERQREPFQPEQYGFDAGMLYGSSRFLIRWARRLLNPLLKLLFNPNMLIHVLHKQTELNAAYGKQLFALREKREELDALYYELVHNLVLELTRVGIESRNLKMKLESLSSRLEFDERRARALEGVVLYRPGTGPAREPQPRPRPQPAPAVAAPAGGQAAEPDQAAPADDQTGESSTTRRRRRRRRGRRGGRGRLPGEAGGQPAEPASADAAGAPPYGERASTPATDAEAADAGSDRDEGDDPNNDPGPDSNLQ